MKRLLGILFVVVAMSSFVNISAMEEDFGGERLVSSSIREKIRRDAEQRQFEKIEAIKNHKWGLEKTNRINFRDNPENYQGTAKGRIDFGAYADSDEDL
jgi:hypothetical protein